VLESSAEIVELDLRNLDAELGFVVVHGVVTRTPSRSI
jgi:hypothetical protein